MTPDERRRMNALCVQIQEEKNFDRFEELTRELIDLVAAKQRRFSERKFFQPGPMGKGWRLMAAIARQVIPPRYPHEVEKVEISISEAEDLFREVRFENSFRDAMGNELSIRAGAELDVRLETNTSSLMKKPSGPS
jgi:hypothetical protein